MVKPPKRRQGELESPCKHCGQEIKTVWMKDGGVRAVEPERRKMIMTNYADASGFYVSMWVPHECEKGE